MPGQVTQLRGEQIWRLSFAIACSPGLKAWVVPARFQSFSQGINRGTFSSVITIKIIIINSAVAYISPVSLSPHLKTLGK